MTHRLNSRPALFTALTVSALLLGYASIATAQKAPGKARRPRLPNYVSRVVDDGQREKINAIQDEYAPKIQKLREELDALTTERDAAIDKVLTPAQRKEVEKLRAEAAERRGSSEDDSKSKSTSKSKKAA